MANLGTSATATQVNNAWVTQTGQQPIDGNTVINIDSNNELWKFGNYEGAGQWIKTSSSFELTAFTNTMLGGIKGSLNKYQVYAEGDGTGSVNDLDLLDSLANATKANFDTHNADGTRHITAVERTAWDTPKVLDAGLLGSVVDFYNFTTANAGNICIARLHGFTDVPNTLNFFSGKRVFITGVYRGAQHYLQMTLNTDSGGIGVTNIAIANFKDDSTAYNPDMWRHAQNIQGSSSAFTGALGGDVTGTMGATVANLLTGTYSGGGGAQGPNTTALGKSRIYMSNENIAGNTEWKEFLDLTGYMGTDVGGRTRIGVTKRGTLRAVIQNANIGSTIWNAGAVLANVSDIPTALPPASTGDTFPYFYRTPNVNTTTWVRIANFVPNTGAWDRSNWTIAIYGMRNNTIARNFLAPAEIVRINTMRDSGGNLAASGIEISWEMWWTYFDDIRALWNGTNLSIWMRRTGDYGTAVIGTFEAANPIASQAADPGTTQGINIHRYLSCFDRGTATQVVRGDGRLFETFQTVANTGSGIAAANAVPRTTASGYLELPYINYQMPAEGSTGINEIMIRNGSDRYMRPTTVANFISRLAAIQTDVHPVGSNTTGSMNRLARADHSHGFLRNASGMSLNDHNITPGVYAGTFNNAPNSMDRFGNVSVGNGVQGTLIQSWSTPIANGLQPQLFLSSAGGLLYRLNNTAAHSWHMLANYKDITNHSQPSAISAEQLNQPWRLSMFDGEFRRFTYTGQITQISNNTIINITNAIGEMHKVGDNYRQTLYPITTSSGQSGGFSTSTFVRSGSIATGTASGLPNWRVINTV
jgi:hypothetical protein